MNRKQRVCSGLAYGLLVLTVWLVGAAAAGNVIEVEPGEDYRPLLDELEPGGELVFLPGEHEGHTVLTISGTEDAPITIRGVLDEDGTPPELRVMEPGHNLWRIRGSHLVIRDLGFHAPHAYAIRVDEANDITIENCVFRDCGSGDLSANTGDVHGLRIRECTSIGARRTPYYIGNHQGELDITGFEFERNVIDGSQIEPAPNTVGYAIQLKLNVRAGIIRENYITGALGPGIMVYGVENGEPGDGGRIERNIVVGSRRNPGIIMGAGPAMAVNNLVLGCDSGGVSVFNYNQWDMLDHIRVVGNIAAVNRPYDYSFARPLTNVQAMGNVAWTLPDADAFRNLPEGDDVRNNNSGEASGALEDAVERLQGHVPDHETLGPIWESLGRPPETQNELAALIERLLEDE